MARFEIDLDALEDRIENRFEALALIPDQLTADGIISSTEMILREDDLLRSVECYFLLSEAYKFERLPHRSPPMVPHRTEPPKVAALTALAIMMFRPFRYIDASQPIRHYNSFVANQTFAMAWAASLLEQDFADLNWDMRRRLYNFLQAIDLRSMREYVDSEMTGLGRRIFEIDLAAQDNIGLPPATGLSNRASDLPVIDMTVLFFELHWMRNAPNTM